MRRALRIVLVALLALVGVLVAVVCGWSPRASRCERDEPQRDLGAGIFAGDATSFWDGTREAATVLEELATLLRTTPLNVIASNRAWTVAANELLLGLACRAEVLRSTASTRSIAVASCWGAGTQLRAL